MLTRPIPSSGEPLPVIGIGTWENFDFASKAPERVALAQVLDVLFAGGGRLIDSSPMYGKAEALVGSLMADRPLPSDGQPKPFLATKVWTSGKREGIAQMELSLKLLGTQTLDLMQVHNLVDWQAHFDTLKGWKSEGRVRYLGITHYTPSAHAELETVMRAAPWDFVQLDYSLEDRAAEERLLPLAAEKGMAVIVNRPFGGGGLIRKLRGTPLPEWAGGAGCSTWAALLLKFILARPEVTCVIPGTGNPKHMHEILEAGTGSLPDPATLKHMRALAKS
ncbi:MAG TPA: aldo/keto reductase [Gammaproteobacteria bacterium]|jgi:diketogulonate reductase-like aldo/keto reductase